MATRTTAAASSQSSTSDDDDGDGKKKKKRNRIPQTGEQKMAKKWLRRARGSVVIVKPVPVQSTLDAYPNWAIVRNDPAIVKRDKRLNTDANVQYWVPISLPIIPWPDLYWLGVVQVKIAGKIWKSLCKTCDKNLICAMDGRGINPKHECTAAKKNIVEIKSQKDIAKEKEAASAGTSTSQ